MEIIAHRRNTRAQLRDTPTEYGIEVDIRSQGGDLIIHHDPFMAGESFDEWLQDYRHGTLILNVKEEGLETRLLACMSNAGIENFFFLDQSFPFLFKTAKTGEKRCAVRLSEFESMETVRTLAGQVDWVWIDCFTRFPLDADGVRELGQLGFKRCVVSPELQGRSAANEIQAQRLWLASENLSVEAVCTKLPLLWQLPLEALDQPMAQS